MSYCRQAAQGGEEGETVWSGEGIGRKIGRAEGGVWRGQTEAATVETLEGAERGEDGAGMCTCSMGGFTQGPILDSMTLHQPPRVDFRVSSTPGYLPWGPFRAAASTLCPAITVL